MRTRWTILPPSSWLPSPNRARLRHNLSHRTPLLRRYHGREKRCVSHHFLLLTTVLTIYEGSTSISTIIASSGAFGRLLVNLCKKQRSPQTPHRRSTLDKVYYLSRSSRFLVLRRFLLDCRQLGGGVSSGYYSQQKPTETAPKRQCCIPRYEEIVIAAPMAPPTTHYFDSTKHIN